MKQEELKEGKKFSGCNDAKMMVMAMTAYGLHFKNLLLLLTSRDDASSSSAARKCYDSSRRPFLFLVVQSFHPPTSI